MAKNPNIKMQKLPIVEEDLSDAFMELPAIQWVRNNLKQISYGAIILLLLVVLAYRLLAFQSARAETDFMAASKSADILNNPESPVEKKDAALLSLTELVSTNSTLQSKYDGLIGQQLLIDHDLDAALPYINRTFARVKDEESSFYLDYAKNSLLIAEGNQDEALKNAYDLKDSIMKEPKSLGVLYAFNLIRIALLEKQTNNKPLELKAWSELKALPPDMISPQDLGRVLTHFDTESATLKNFTGN